MNPITLFFLLALAVPAVAQPPGAGDERVRKLEAQVAELQAQVQALLKAQNGRPAEATSGPPAGDPLAAAEAQLGGQATAPAIEPTTGAADPLAATEQQAAGQGAAQGPRGFGQQYFNPLISVITDFAVNDPSLGDAANIGENRDKLNVREVEFAFQAPIDPFARADIFAAVPNLLEGGAFTDNIELEEAYITYWRLPWDLQMRGGKWFLPFGKENPVHSHEFAYMDRSLMGQTFLGEEGISGAGVELYKPFNLSDDYSTQLHLLGNVVSPTTEESLFVDPLNNQKLFLARGRLYHEFDGDNNIDVGYTWMKSDYDPTLKLEQKLQGIDVTYRWEPTAELGYEKLLVRAEHAFGDRDLDPANVILPGQTELELDGTYVMADYQFQKYWAVGARYDNTAAARGIAEQIGTNDPTAGNTPNDRLTGYAAWLTWWSTEFNRFRLQYTHLDSNFPRGPTGAFDEDVVSVQWTWFMGPHGAHKY